MKKLIVVLFLIVIPFILFGENFQNKSNLLYSNELGYLGNVAVTKGTPFLKGQQGVNSAIDSFKNKGGQILNKEVTINFNGTKIRADAIGQLNGKYYIIEAKNGLGAGFTRNQGSVLINSPLIGTPVGQNAIKAGLDVSQSYKFNFYLHWID